MRIVFAAILTLLASPALAHHPMDGAMPTTLWHGLLSGVGHPVIGIDHLAFIVAAGVLAATVGGRSWLLAPLGLVAGALAGAAIHLAALDIPGVEALISLSVLVTGAAIAFSLKAGVGVLAAAFAVAGVFHGYAYAEAVIGAETGVVAAYLAAFSATQWAIAALAGFAVKLLIGEASWARSHKLAGGAFTVLGLVFLAQTIG